MTPNEHIRLMRKLIREWYRGKTYEAQNEYSISNKCTYEITNVRCEGCVFIPKVLLDVKIHHYHYHYHYHQRNNNVWVKLSKPGGSRLRTINNVLRRLILEDKRGELAMFDITNRRYNIKVGTIKWELVDTK